jgi:predicted secreted protein with PEFG-CTERM motif
MNRYVALVPVAILILGGTGIVSQAFAATVMTVETDSHVYDHASTIILTGNVFPVDVGGSEITILCKSPAGVCGIGQIIPNSDGDFSAMFDTSSKLFINDGIYEFELTYSSLASASISVELVDAIETSSEGSESSGSEMGTAVSGTVTKSGITLHELGAGQLEYDMTCDANPAFFANSDDDSIVIHLDPKNDGIITLTLHEELIKPFADGTFAVIINNQEMQDFTQVGNTLTIPCAMGTEKIEIHGSWAIPEFGVIAAMILAVAIVSIIVVTAKTRLSIVPRY